MHISYQTLGVRDHRWRVARHSFAENFVGVVLLNIQYEIVHEHVPYTIFSFTSSASIASKSITPEDLIS